MPANTSGRDTHNRDRRTWAEVTKRAWEQVRPPAGGAHEDGHASSARTTTAWDWDSAVHTAAGNAATSALHVINTHLARCPVQAAGQCEARAASQWAVRTRGGDRVGASACVQVVDR